MLGKKLNGLVAVCVAAIIIGALFSMLRTKEQNHELAGRITALQAENAMLANERDTLKAKTAEKIECDPPPALPPVGPQSELQSVLDPAPQGQGDTQAAIDTLKKRYEDILVTYFVLRQCAKIQPADYHIIISALAQEMASVNAPGRLQYDILTSAQGSYKELYASGTCDAAIIDPLQTRYQTFIDGIAGEFLPR
ncbi:MAG: hypothetical protein SFX19_03860 [Alphaproteobacteria bacterium]|nr:hypothetical protein [Alphaproteobacteria bacterium]